VQFLKNFAWYWLANSVYYAHIARKMKEWQKDMKEGLFKGYDSQGATKRGGVDEFIKHVGKRDRDLVCIHVDFEKTNENKFIYRMYECPFLSSQKKLENVGVKDCKEISTKGYLKAKIDYFLDKNWELRTTKCIWNGEDFCEHIFYKK